MDIFPGISALIAANLVIRQVLETGGGEQGVLGILFLKSQTEALQRKDPRFGCEPYLGHHGVSDGE